MSGTPDLSTLPQRMRYAAQVIGEANDRLHYGTIEDLPPPVLRSLADEWEAEDRAAAEHEALVEELVQEIVQAVVPGLNINLVNLATTGDMELHNVARKLIENGWTKEGSS